MSTIGQNERPETQLLAGVERTNRFLRDVSAPLPADKDPTEGQRSGQHDHRHAFHRSEDRIKRRRKR